MPKETGLRYVTFEFEDGSTYQFNGEEYYNARDCTELVEAALEKRGKVIGNLADKK